MEDIHWNFAELPRKTSFKNDYPFFHFFKNCYFFDFRAVAPIESL